MSKSAISIIAVILAVALLFSAFKAGTSQSTITATGSSTLSYEPDEAVVGVYVVTTKDSAADSQKENARISDAVIAALKKAGVPSDSIETLAYTVYPEYSYERREPVLTGYKTTHGLKVATLRIDSVGSLIDAASGAGANQFDSVQFRLSDAKLEKVKSELLADATRNARSKAESMAKAASLKLGKVKTLSESSYGVTPFYSDLKALSSAESAPTQIQPGGVEVSAYVSVVYGI